MLLSLTLLKINVNTKNLVRRQTNGSRGGATRCTAASTAVGVGDITAQWQEVTSVVDR